MTKAIENAKKRLSELQRQAAEIERFLQLYEAFESGTDVDQGDMPSHRENAQFIGNFSTETSVDKPVKNARRRGPRPTEIVKIMERLIREAGRPLTRGEIIAALEHRAVQVPGADKPRYIGTIAWRNKSIFMNVEGLGYWLRREPLPVAMGLPLNGGSMELESQ